jgi:hypothetical protein
VFHHCDKTPETINLKGGKMYFDSVQSMVGWLCWFGACGQAEIMVGWGEGMWQRKTAHFMWVGSKKRERRVLSPNIPFKGTPPVT